ncbi:ABC transporter permease [Pedobacter caeni]|uniref:Putative ABC transport system permease protein n=1 Tax=Pedobacter caeni TaxID=288992 RepID=A0A1M5AMH0_9SPHI|nr:ABC transporter permease [Pedobacter caeni]SHF31297.1 putative ABC transport system permease protein [Pedobacter caeni]
MFKLNLKIAFRNLLKNRGYAVVNVLGLVFGLTSFLLLLMYINHEQDYDRWDSGLSNVYQVRERHDFFSPDGKQHWQYGIDSKIAGLLKKSIPQFRQVTKVSVLWRNGTAIKIGQSEPILMNDLLEVDSLFFKVFPYKFLKGVQKTAVSEPNTMVLKESAAKKLFGTLDVLGKHVKVLRWSSDEGKTYQVKGLIADPSTPESLSFGAVLHSGEREKDPEGPGSTNYCQVYALAGDQIDTTAVAKAVQKTYIDYKKSTFAALKTSYDDYYKGEMFPGLKVVPLQQVHADPPLSKSWLEKVKPIIGLTVFLLLVSVINFVNLATVQSVQRAKEVGVKKVLGAYKRSLLMQFLLEAAILSSVALVISIALTELLLPVFGRHFEIEMTFWNNSRLWSLMIQLGAVFVVVTLLSGFYPALVLSNCNPVDVLKGTYERGLKGVALRNGLLVLQFVIAVTFIIGIGVMFLQSSYVAHKNPGFEPDRLINIKTSYQEDLAEKIRRVPGVKYVATTTQVMGNVFNVPREITYKSKDYKLNTVTVTMDALQALGTQLVVGRLFSRAYAQDTLNAVVLNEAAAKLLGGHMLGQQYVLKDEGEKHTFQVVGIIKDYHNEGFDKEILPTIYKASSRGGTSSTNNLLIRFENENYQQTISLIEAEWKKKYPDYPMVYTAAESAFQDALKADRRFIEMVTVFSFISVALSLLGLFALAAFVSKRRTKEIAIRKILGASDLQIIRMLNRSFLILVLFANVISWPIAYVLTNKWLSGFAYRIDMPVFPFILATLLSLTVALLTVSLQAKKAAVSDPVNALKYE